MSNLLDHLIEENFRLCERLNKISLKSNRRKKQLTQLLKSIGRSNESIKFLEASVEARTKQINNYAAELELETRMGREQQYELLKEREDLVNRIDELSSTIYQENALSVVLKEENNRLNEKLQRLGRIKRFLKNLFSRKKVVT